MSRSLGLRNPLAVFSMLLLASAGLLAPPAHAADETPSRRSADHPWSETPITVEIDATDLPRKLLHSDVTIPVRPGPMALHFIKWVPGNHGPSGPIQNMIDLFIRDDAGNEIPWTRDYENVARIQFVVPEGTDDIVASFGYIANQPSVVSQSSDSYGFAHFGGINWNTVVVYPEGAHMARTMYDASVRMPRGWEQRSSLPVESASGSTVRFEPVTLAELVDSPLLMGRWVKDYPFELEGRPPHVFSATADKPERLELPAERVRTFEEMVRQSEAIFGPFPRDEYHFLIYVDSRLPGFGLEHWESTFIDMSDEELINAGKPDGSSMGVVPHEYVHVWCGKLRAPEGLVQDDFHTTGETELMWVYEGMTSYYDDVVSVRCGLITEDRYRNRLAGSIQRYQLQAGRLWRPLADTARALRILRAGSPRWGDLRRRQDYYGEGALFWMEADAIIRRGTNGEKSLDDFARAFFDVPANPVGELATYTRDDVVDTLESVYAGEDWDALIRTRIERPVERLEIELPRRLGYRLEYFNEPTEEQARRAKRDRDASLRNSIGINVDADGVIESVVPGSVADEAGLGYEMTIVAVGDKVYTPDALKEAVKASPETGRIDLTYTADGENLEEVALRYRGGMRWPRLMREEGEPDILAEIMKPR